MIKTTVSAEIGMMSEVWVSGEFPLSFGNYFGFRSGEYCVNMWAENFEEECKRKNITDVEVEIYGNMAVVIDPRIEWTNKKPCTTGMFAKLKDYREMCENHGWQDYLDGLLCGCESDEEYPHVSYSYNYDTNKTRITKVCEHCGKRQLYKELDRK
jgi:hypothetical protein